MEDVMFFFSKLFMYKYFTDVSFVILELVTVLSFLSTNLIFIRWAVLFTNLGYIVTILITGLHIPGMLTLGCMSFLTAIIISYKLFIFYKNVLRSCIDKHLLSTYDMYFNKMKPFQFNLFMKYARLNSFEGELLKEKNDFSALIFIEYGGVDILRKEQTIIKLNQGEWLGELSYFSNLPVSNTVIANKGSRFIVIKKDQIAELKNQEPEVFDLLESIIIKKLCKKLAKMNTKLKNLCD